MHPLLTLLPLLLLFSLLQPRAALSEELQCRDANGDPLDWFAMLKQPDGHEYAYIKQGSSNAWIKPSQPDLTKSGPVAATIRQVLGTGSSASGSPDVLAAYNDEPPESSGSPALILSSAYGHMKGVVALTAGQRGFWLIHSVPKFPDLSQSAYAYPPTGIKYGQSFLCITVNSSDMADAIGRQLFASHPDLYSISVSAAAMDRWPTWAELKRRTPPPAQLLNSTAHLLTAAGLPVMHLAKSAHLREDLYADLLAGQLDSSLQVETWQHGGHLLNSTCSRRYNVTKVLRVQIGDSLSEFRSTLDHSKWCVATGRSPYVCIGDMNRAESQFKRGGGIACMALPGPHRLFKAAVLSDQACGSEVENNRDDATRDEMRELMEMFNWVMIAVLCATACTIICVLLLLWLVTRSVRKNIHVPYQSL